MSIVILIPEMGDIPPSPVEINFGGQTTGGGGNWGASTDRAMFRQVTCVSPNGSPLTIKAIHIAFRIAGNPAEFVKGLVYSDNANSPGNRIAVSDPVNDDVTGYVRLAVIDSEIPSGTILWIGAVWSFGAFEAEFDSELIPVAPNTVLMNGTVDYTNPPAVAPAPDASYANTLACYLECTYVP
jgi:hypothetical protein